MHSTEGPVTPAENGCVKAPSTIFGCVGMHYSTGSAIALFGRGIFTTSSTTIGTSTLYTNDDINYNQRNKLGKLLSVSWLSNTGTRSGSEYQGMMP
jgi:hypothetical protein